MAITDKQPIGNRIFTFDALPSNVPAEGLQPGDFVLDSSTNYLYLVSSGHALVQVAAQGGGTQVVQTATVTLTDAQIRALRTSAVEIVAAPGANKGVMPTICILRHKWTANYTNIDGDAFLYLHTPTTTDHIVSALLESSGNVSALLANDESSMGWLLPAPSRTGIGDADIINKVFSLSLNNGLSGDLVGGSAFNELQVTLYYIIFDAP